MPLYSNPNVVTGYSALYHWHNISDDSLSGNEIHDEPLPTQHFAIGRMTCNRILRDKEREDQETFHRKQVVAERRKMDAPGSTNRHRKSKRPKRSVSPASGQSSPPPVLPPSVNPTRPDKKAPPPLIRADDPVDIDPALRAEYLEERETVPRSGNAPVAPRDRHARRLVFDRGRKSLQSVPLWHRAQDLETTQRSNPLNPPEICEPSRSATHFDKQPPFQALSRDSATVSRIASMSLQESSAMVPVPVSITVEDDSLSDYDSGD